MTLLDRYIRKTLILSVLMVLLTLGGLDLMFSLFDELTSTDQGYQAQDAVLYSLLTFPRRIYELLSFSALIGALAGLGVMASSHELVVMQAAGIKVSRIVWSVMQPTVLIMLFGFCLGEFIAPALELKAEVAKAIASGEEVILSRYGFWERENNQYMHFNAIDPDGLLHGVTIYELDDERNRVSDTVAQFAEFHQDSEQSYWVLIDGHKTEFPVVSNSFEAAGDVADLAIDTDRAGSSFAFERLTWNVDLSPELLQLLIIDTDKMAISDLYRYASRFESQGQDASAYKLSFWKKLLQPLTTGALILVAVSFIFGPLREATIGSRVFVAVCFGLVFTIFQRLLNTLSLVFDITPLVAVMLPIIIVLGIGIIMLRRAT